MRKLYSKEDFMLVFNLVDRFPWLKKTDKQEALIDLLGICDDVIVKNLIQHTIENFTYLNGEKISELIDLLVSQILDVWSLDPSMVQLVASTFDSDADSAQSILWMMKKSLGQRPGITIEKSNRVGDAIRKSINHPHIILIDEFIGTGQTLLGRVRYLRKNIQEYYRTQNYSGEFEIRACVLACMVPAVARVQVEVPHFYAPLTLKRGLSDYYIGFNLLRALEAMLSLESKLEHNVPSKPFPTFVYGRAEALYGMENGNAVNSVFPMFWWPYLRGMKRRRTMFSRSEEGL